MRTSGEKVYAYRMQQNVFIPFHILYKIIDGVLYTMLLSSAY